MYDLTSEIYDWIILHNKVYIAVFSYSKFLLLIVFIISTSVNLNNMAEINIIEAKKTCNHV